MVDSKSYEKWIEIRYAAEEGLILDQEDVKKCNVLNMLFRIFMGGLI